MTKSLTAFDLAGMTPKQLLDAENITKEHCIAMIRGNLHADDSNLDEDAEKIYNYFASKNINFLVSEFVYSLEEDPEYNFDALAAELE